MYSVAAGGVATSATCGYGSDREGTVGGMVGMEARRGGMRGIWGIWGPLEHLAGPSGFPGFGEGRGKVGGGLNWNSWRGFGSG